MSRVDQALRRASGHAPLDAEREIDPSMVRLHEFPAEDRRSTVVPKLPQPVVQTAVPAPVAGSVPQLGASVQGRVVVDPLVPGVCLEEYRRLASTLHLLQAEKGIRT